jgi:2-keto-4-pentenoate hydratase
MPSGAQIEAAAQALLTARSSGRPQSMSLAEPADTTAAYRIQDAVARRHGGIDGWKVGARSREAIPTCAPLLRGSVMELSPHRDHDVAVSGAVGIELEIAYRIGRGFAPDCTLRDEEVLDAIEEANIAVEVCASRLAANDQSKPMWLLADNQMNERLVVGPPLPSWHDLHFATLAARIAVNGKPLVHTVGGHPAGEPLGLLLWLVRHCVQHRDGLQAGQIVTTGSWTGMPIVEPPVQVTAEFLGVAGLTFTVLEPAG